MNRNSRVLQLVVAGVLLSQVGMAAATIYDDDPVVVPGSDDDGRVTVVGNYFGGVSTTYDYGPDTVEDNDYSNDGRGGNEDSAEEKADLCRALSELAPVGCDLRSPPRLTVNGCGGGIFVNAVPDYLAIGGVPNYSLGPIFENACNKHDTCYATYLMDKVACDEKLSGNMIRDTQNQLSDIAWFFYQNAIRSQASLYSSALQTAPILSLANGLYADAQVSGKCRAYAEGADAAECFE